MFWEVSGCFGRGFEVYRLEGWTSRYFGIACPGVPKSRGGSGLLRGFGAGRGGGDSRGLGFKGFRGNALEVFWRFRA